MVRNLLSTLIVVLVAIAAGFRPEASVLGWLGAVGMVMLFILALSWVAVVVGLLAKSAEAASGFTFFILFLPYLSSAFVPTDTMPSVLQGIAEHQPVTPMIETIRGLLLGAGVGDNAWLAAAWFGGIAVAAFTASVALYRRRLSQ